MQDSFAYVSNKQTVINIFHKQMFDLVKKNLKNNKFINGQNSDFVRVSELVTSSC